MKAKKTKNAFVAHCGMYTTIFSPGYCEMKCDPRPELMNTAGFYHGGAIFSLIDTAAGRAACYLPDGYRPLVTQSASVYYVRPCKDSVLRAEAHCMQQGRTTALVTVEVFDDKDRMISKGEVSCYYTGGLSDERPYVI